MCLKFLEVSANGETRAYLPACDMEGNYLTIFCSEGILSLHSLANIRRRSPVCCQHDLSTGQGASDGIPIGACAGSIAIHQSEARSQAQRDAGDVVSKNVSNERANPRHEHLVCAGVEFQTRAEGGQVIEAKRACLVSEIVRV